MRTIDSGDTFHRFSQKTLNFHCRISPERIGYSDMRNSRITNILHIKSSLQIKIDHRKIRHLRHWVKRCTTFLLQKSIHLLYKSRIIFQVREFPQILPGQTMFMGIKEFTFYRRWRISHKLCNKAACRIFPLRSTGKCGIASGIIILPNDFSKLFQIIIHIDLHHFSKIAPIVTKFTRLTE